MFNALFLSLAQTRFFWNIRNVFSRLGFFFYRTLFGMKYHVREGSTTVESWLMFLWAVLGKLVLAILLTALLQFFNPHFTTWFTKIGFTIPEESNYGTFLSAVIGVGGVFIALYYAAVSTIGSAIYARFPNNIRDLLAHEKLGSAYMRLLALITFFGICLLIFHTAGLQPIILAMPLLIVGTGVMVFGFIRLGTRVFNLFDPTSLSHSLFDQLQQRHRQMQAGGYRWSNQSFQRSSHQIAQRNIDTLATLSEIVAKEPHLNGRPFARLCNNLLLFLCNYEKKRKLIPTNSLWYRQRYEHSDWYRTGDMETSLAHDTSTGLQPKVVRDIRWIESEILPIVQRCLATNIKEKRYTIVIELLDYIDYYIRRIAKEHQVEYAFNLIGNVFGWCEELIFVEEDNLVAEEPLEHMEICNRLATMLINILLAYTSTIESYGRDAILQRISHIKWKSERSIYRSGFAVHVLPRLEWMRQKLEFEARIERNTISPSWYLQELIAQQEAENLQSVMICLCEKARELYKHWIGIAKSSRHPWLEVVIVSRESEYWNKFDYHMNTLNQLWNDLNSDQRIEGIPWPNLDIDELMEKRRQRHKELLEIMSEKNLLLSLISRPESYPDFAGEFLHTVGEALFVAMVENDCELVKTLFGRYFGGSLLQFDKLRSEECGTDWQNLNNLKIAAAPLLDLMDMSGYVYLLSDYHDDHLLKEPIVKAWDKYFNEEQENQRLQSLAAAVSLSESGFEIEHRGINRTRWKQMIQRRLSDVERQEIPPYPTQIIQTEPDTIPVHNSPLVRIFARDFDFLSYDGIDIFLAKYIRQYENGGNLDFGWRRNRRNLEEDINREENQDTRYQGP